MATAHPLAASGRQPAHGAPAPNAPVIAAEQALVPAAHGPAEGAGISLRAPVARLPVELDVSVPVRNFRVRNLLALEPAR